MVGRRMGWVPIFRSIIKQWQFTMDSEEETIYDIHVVGDKKFKTGFLRVRNAGNTIRRNILILLVCASLFTILLSSSWSHRTVARLVTFTPPEEGRGFLVETGACAIPDIDPFAQSVKKFITFNASGYVLGNRLKCSDTEPITYQDGNYLRIKFNIIKNKHFSHCEFTSIHRKADTDSGITFSKAVKLTSDIIVRDEFLRVNCFTNTSSEPFYTNYHAFVIPKNDSIKDLNEKFKSNKFRSKETLNVVMVGIDSVSRLNHIRSMPKVRDFLLNHLSAIELQGYTKVADNTFVNVVPLTTGKFLEELPWNETLSGQPFDKYNFIWKNFSNNGYPTLYAEDAPGISTFNYLKFGFLKPPGLHYYRPISKAMEDDGSIWNSGHHCVHDRPETTVVLDYVHDFMRTYRNRPHFSYAFISRLTHDVITDAIKADDPYVTWLKSVHQEGLLNNTVLIFFSDHGLRFGSFRETYIGKLEERLPMMYLVFPKWFLKKYPKVSENLNINKNRLTSPFDIYATLKNILYFNGTLNTTIDPKERGISLLNKIPESRTCEHAGILPHWCVCMAQTSLPTNDPLAIKSVDFLVKVINKRLQVNVKCERLSLKNIKSVQLMKSNDKVLRFVSSKNDVINRVVTYTDSVKAISILQVSVTLTPGLGEFEATVKYEETSGEFSMAGDISRINLYGHDGDCVSDSKLRKVCYCVK